MENVMQTVPQILTGVKYNTIQKRLKNPNFGNYFYVKYPNKINNETIKVEE